MTLRITNMRKFFNFLGQIVCCDSIHGSFVKVNTVEHVLKTSIKRPPLHNDHTQVRPSNIW